MVKLQSPPSWPTRSLQTMMWLTGWHGYEEPWDLGSPRAQEFAS